MKRFGALLIALFFSSVTASVFADAAKIGVVDLQKIMQTSNQMKTIQQNRTLIQKKNSSCRAPKVVRARQMS